MHIEPGVVQGAKLLLSVGTALTAGGLMLRYCWEFLVQHGLNILLGRTIFTIVTSWSFRSPLDSWFHSLSPVWSCSHGSWSSHWPPGPRGLASTMGSTSVWNERYDFAATTLFGFCRRRAGHSQADHLPGSELWTGSTVIACLPGRNRQLGCILGLLRAGIWSREHASGAQFWWCLS